jgi:hypothetical protein
MVLIPSHNYVIFDQFIQIKRCDKQKKNYILTNLFLLITYWPIDIFSLQ